MKSMRLPALFAALALCPMPICASAQLHVGDRAPTELGVARNGDPVRLPEKSNQVHAVSFWASWCGPCKVELPMLERLQRVIGPDRLRVIAVNIEDREVFRRVTREMWDWKMTLSNDQYKGVQKSYKGDAVPHLTIIGRDGLVKKVFIGYAEDSLESVVTAIVEAIRE